MKLAADTNEMIGMAARLEGISRAQYLREGGIMRAGFTFAEATHSRDYDALRRRIEQIERHLGLEPPTPST